MQCPLLLCSHLLFDIGKGVHPQIIAVVPNSFICIPSLLSPIFPFLNKMWAEHIPLLFFPFFLQRNLSRSSCPSTPFPALCLCFCVFFCFVKFVQTSRVGSTYRPAFPTSLRTLIPVLPFIPSHQHTTSSLCVSLSFVVLLGGIVSAACRRCFHHKFLQRLAIPYFVGHSTAAAGKVNTRQRSAVMSKIQTYVLNLAESQIQGG